MSEWADEHITLSLFLVRFATIETVLGSPRVKAAACLPDAKLAVLVERMRRLPFADASWPELPSRLFARGDALALVSPNGPGESTVWVGADSDDDLAFIEDLVDGEWD